MFFKSKNPAKPILDKYIDGDFSLFACGADAPNKTQIEKFEKEVGLRLPDDFRTFSMSPLGGIYIEVKESLWPRPRAGDVGPFWSFLYAIFSHGFSEGIPAWMNIRIQREQFKAQTGHDVVPCLKLIGDADFYCFDRNAKLLRWRHEGDEFETINEPFLKTFEAEVQALLERKEKKRAESGAQPQA